MTIETLKKCVLAVQSWHEFNCRREWLGPLRLSNGLLLIACLAVLAAASLNYKVRLDQYSFWMAHPEITELDGGLTFSTTDASFFLGHAKALKLGSTPETIGANKLGLGAGEHQNKVIPSENLASKNSSKNSATSSSSPLLSTIISWLTPTTSTKDLLTTAHHLILVSAVITTLMVAYAFAATGYLLEGAVAALGGGLSAAYLLRSSAGRIDTDQLNLGFMYLLFGLIVTAAHAKTFKALVSLSAVAALTAQFFFAWYGKPELIWLVALSFIWLIIVLQSGWRRKAAALGTFLALAPLHLSNPFSSSYFVEKSSTGAFIFPNTFSTITEVSQISFAEILTQISGSVEMGILCLLGIGLWAIRHPILVIAFGPLIAFAALNYFIGNRAIFYSAPIFWFGFGFLVTSGTRFIFMNATNMVDRPKAQMLRNGLFGLSTLLAMSVAWANSPTNYIPRPSFPKPILDGFSHLKTLDEGQRHVVATWWDYGYASMFLNGLPTLHDGGTQNTPTTFFVAQALLDQSQERSVNILRFLARDDVKNLKRFSSVQELNEALVSNSNEPSPAIFLVLTNQIQAWMGSITTLGNWDIQKGIPTPPPLSRSGQLLKIDRVGCSYSQLPKALQCRGGLIDLERGTIGGVTALSKWSYAANGFADTERQFRKIAPLSAQTLKQAGRLTTQVMHPQLFDSTFNRLFNLGIIEHKDISLVYDDYPNIRIYRIASPIAE